jgi:hypothetical protein
MNGGPFRAARDGTLTCYGDLKAPVEELAKARKMTVVGEA